MNESDRRRWDRKYAEKEPHADITADPFLLSSLPGIVPGRALDVACGFGDNAIRLAQEGFEVTGLDISEVALERARRRAAEQGVTVRFVCADVDDFEIGDQTYDLITGFYFLHRPAFSRIKKGVKPGGMVVYKTYTADEVRYRPVLNRNYLLEPGELKSVFEDFQLLLYDERDNGEECSVRMIARRPPTDMPGPQTP
jgi:2-polyprenyl-3-methyl-5-hydroxy-6-metoxy-1,4-benzoquinol methylase